LPSFSFTKPSLRASFWSESTDAAVYSPLAIFTSLEPPALEPEELGAEAVELDELDVAELALDDASALDDDWTCGADEACAADDDDDADEVESTDERRFVRKLVSASDN